MNRLLKKLIMALLVPVIYYFIYTQLMPNPASGSGAGPGVLSFLPVVGKLLGKNMPAGAADSTASQAASLAELSRLLGRATADTSDTLAADGKGKRERDPMIPMIPADAQSRTILARAPAAPTKFPITRSDITGIFWDEKNPIVLMWRKPYQVGAEVRGARITAINRTSVMFTWQGQTITVKLK
ncbi:MAG: hypothetical protein HY710_16860 [Candidatus Latescibacteria bacterium]|nr:hypothetical protein [Candidatus Latescibacterota bacterium]